MQIKASKHRPFRHGVTLCIGAMDGQLCPVAAVSSHMVARGNETGPLFKWTDGRFLTWDKFVTWMRMALKTAGVAGKKYAGHSFHIGAATTVAQCGV